jgi:hypothetical protein
MTDIDIHSCGYYCDRPACVKAQRNELRDKLFGEQWIKTYSGGKPNYTQPIEQIGITYEEANPPEPMIDGWPLYSGLPPVKIQDERETQYKSWAQSAQVIGGQYDPRREWVGLTGYEVNECAAGCHNGNSVQDAVRKAEAKLKDKNG